jgi:hypothetical protein
VGARSLLNEDELMFYDYLYSTTSLGQFKVRVYDSDEAKCYVCGWSGKYMDSPAIRCRRGKEEYVCCPSCRGAIVPNYLLLDKVTFIRAGIAMILSTGDTDESKKAQQY